MLKFDWNMLWTLINLLLFYVMMRIFLFKPIKKAIDERNKLLDKRFSDAEECQKQADSIKAEYEKQLSGVEEEKKVILADANVKARKEYNKIVDRAQADADKIKRDARRSADMELETARISAKEQIAEIAMETAAKIVGNQSSAELDSELYDKFLNESSDE